MYQSHPWVLAVLPSGETLGVLADTTHRCEVLAYSTFYTHASASMCFLYVCLCMYQCAYSILNYNYVSLNDYCRLSRLTCDKNPVYGLSVNNPILSSHLAHLLHQLMFSYHSLMQSVIPCSIILHFLINIQAYL